MTDLDFPLFNKDLVECEIFDHSELLNLLVEKIISKEGKLLMTIDQIEKEYSSGNFNINPSLKIMLIHFVSGDSSRNQILEKGLITNMNYVGFTRYSGFVIALHHVHVRERSRVYLNSPIN